MMSYNDKGKLTRRKFLENAVISTAAVTTALGAKPLYASRKKRKSFHSGKKVIILGIDGMDPRLSEKMMADGSLPNFAKLRNLGGYRVLGTSIPPQSPVAWANFINGAGPGSHGIFDFIHRHPEKQCETFCPMAETVPGKGCWNIGKHKLQLDFWPFNHKPPATKLLRKGTPFWDYLDEAGICSTFYNLPSDYPPSPSKNNNHKCLSGLGTPDIMGTSGDMYHYFAEKKPYRVKKRAYNKLTRVVFRNDTTEAKLYGPQNPFLRKPQPVFIEFLIHRDRRSKTAVIEIQDHKIVLKEGLWSDWIDLDFEWTTAAFLPDKNISGICRFYLKEAEPNFQLYVSPVNINPADPATQISEPSNFSTKISKELGLFYTVGFQEDFYAREENIFTDDEFAIQADMVLQQRLELLEYALKNYEDGVLFFYFSSTDLQSHIFFWDSLEKHPFRSHEETLKYHNTIKKIYMKMDAVLGDILKRYGNQATIIALSDHGFACYKRKFNLNTWLRNNGYIKPSSCTAVISDAQQKKNGDENEKARVNWSKTTAYGLGINGLYLNLKGREKQGIVEPGQRDRLLQELITKLEALRDIDGSPVIRKVYRSDEVYSGPQVKNAPDLIIGYYRGYRTGNFSAAGYILKDVLWDNTDAWSADHCFDPREVPGVLFCNKHIKADQPSLIDLAPTILAEFGLKTPLSMTGQNIFT